MKLGFVSAIFPDLDLESVLAFARDAKFATVEVMCWPLGKAERRYAGVTHVDVEGFDASKARGVRDLCSRYGVSISGLGYYPNPLAASESEAQVYIGHLRNVISASAMLGIGLVNTFVGRDPSASEQRNWELFDRRWPAIVEHAEREGVRLGIENCPMFFTKDEWPGGKNLAVSPKSWREMFRRIPSRALGLNYDPSHMVWQQMDCSAPVLAFRDRLFHVHAKDAKVDHSRLDDVGILATPLEFHEPRLPGRGDVDWSRFCGALTSAAYDGPVCIESEDREFEGSLESRKAGLVQSAAFIRQFLPL